MAPKKKNQSDPFTFFRLLPVRCLSANKPIVLLALEIMSELRAAQGGLSLESWDFFVMDERRKSQRQRVLKAGKIMFNRGAGIDCTVRNLSKAGACLDVASPLGIPDDFILLIGSEQVQHRCHITWRREKRIGVDFN